MDQGLKERLIGAAVLVALGVWLIPWVLDGPEPEAPDPATALNLPVPDEPLPVRRQTLRVGEGADTADAPQAEAEPPPELPPAPLEPRALELPPPALPRQTDAEPVAEAAKPPAPPPVSTPPAETPVETARTAERPPAAAPAPAPRAAPQPPAPAAAAAGDWVVQLGSFSEEENARRLAQRVSTFGYKPQIASYRASGRTMYRVRVGPHATRGEAQAAASALSAHGFVAQVVTVE
jgi:DedD protein